ncbi:MAG: hypothetical protein JW709_01535 [Sedimentisphaerales bacterium]|nr:hypothetical protein [Sedimentisphaerales bacterium]
MTLSDTSQYIFSTQPDAIELCRQAINHISPVRLPWTLYLTDTLERQLINRWGQRQQWPCPADDVVKIVWPLEFSEVSESGFTDMFGCRWHSEHGGFNFDKPLFDELDAKHISTLELIRDEDIERILRTRREHPDKFIFYQLTITFGERLWTLFGMENMLMAYLTEPLFVHAALDKLLEMHLTALDRLMALPIDGVSIGDDYGAQRGLMISQSIFREFFKPRLAMMYEKVRQAGKVIMHHSCGDNTDIMGDFVDIGLEVFHPLQPEAMDIRKIKQEYGRDLAFRGGIGTQGDIVFGSPDQARREVRQAVEILSAGGGYLLEPCKPLPEDTPLDNVVAVIEEMTKAMHYDFT